MKNQFSYRPDIDGLRAIAVLLVILFHADFSLFSGGYIGVDVFFVLSGFLITYTINQEMLENRFSFQQFYLRRIRRIIPVLVFVLLAFTIPAYFILFADHFEIYGRTILHTILSTNNFYLWDILRNYFTENADLIPFLHTWSLSVEEQFYFVWPVLLLGMHQFIGHKTRNWFMLILISGLTILSIYLTNKDANMSYFLLPARFFELGIGAGLAMFWNQLPNISKTFKSILSIIGLMLIFIPAFQLDKTSLFPGINALWPCLGTAILIFTGKQQNQLAIINQGLKNKALVWTGLLSYSLYLWHWPIFIFIKYLGIPLDGIVRIGAILLTFLLSYFSWKFIEQPFRTTLKFDFTKTIKYILIPSLLLILGIYGLLDSKDGFPNRFPTLSEFNPKTNYPNKVRKKCFDQFQVGNCNECFLGVKKDKLDGVLIGDSFGNHTAAFLDILAKDAGLYLHDSTAGGFPVMENLNDDGSYRINNHEYAVSRMNYAMQFGTIYIAANWDEQGEPTSKNYQSIITEIGKLVSLNKKVVIFDCLLPTTEVNLHKAKLAKSGNTIFFTNTNFDIEKRTRPTTYIVYELKRRFPSITIIDLNDVMCDDKKCKIELENTIVYRNFNHLNTSGAELMSKKYLELKGNPLKK